MVGYADNVMHKLKLALVYFLIVFGAGFVLGIIRVLFALPLLGERAAELLEMPLMLTVIVLAARWITKRYLQHTQPREQLTIGWIATGCMLAADFLVGATLRGLMRHHGTDPKHFLWETHQFPDLRRMLDFQKPTLHTLGKLPGKKILFSNAPRHYTDAILDMTGLDRCFAAIYSVENLRFQPKPMLAGFRTLLRAEHLDPKRCIMVEDTLANLQTAKRLGMRTVWVCGSTRQPSFVDLRLVSILDLPRSLQRLSIGELL